MMYPYITLGDGTEIVHSQVIFDDAAATVIYHLARPTEHGFDSARCELPTYTWTTWEGGFSDAERLEFEEFLRSNAHLLYRYAASGGLKVA